MRAYYCIFLLFLFHVAVEAQKLSFLSDTLAIGAITTLQWKSDTTLNSESIRLVWKRCDLNTSAAGSMPTVPDIEAIDADPSMAKYENDTLVLNNLALAGEIKFRFFDKGIFCLYQGDKIAGRIQIEGPDPTNGDIEDIQPLETFQAEPQYQYLYGLLAFIMLFSGIWYFKKHWKKSKAKTSIDRDLPSAREEALERLNHVLSSLETEERLEWAVDEVTQTLRTYIHHGYGIQAAEMTSHELIRAFQKTKPQAFHGSALKEIFEKTDLFKFAKAPLDATEIKILTMASIEFVQRNPTAL
jgi:hypothetical protein